MDIYIINIRVNNRMGACFNQKQQMRAALDTPLEFQNQKQNKNRTMKPLQTTLYNLLRKSNQLEIIHNGVTQKNIFNNESNPNLDSLNEKQIKMLYSFKNILLVGNCDGLLQKIYANSNPKVVYQVDEEEAIQFVKMYPIFGSNQQSYQSKQIPIYAINSQQILKTGAKKRIFMHVLSNSNSNQLYQKLGLNKTVVDTPQYTRDQLCQLLKNTQSSSILFLHSKNRTQEDLLQILAQYLVAEYKVSPFNAKIYLRKILPQTSLMTSHNLETNQQGSENLISIPVRSASLKQIPKQSLSLTQLYQKYFHQLYQQMGADQRAKTKVLDSHNLLSTLLSNIYNNKGNDGYRRVRKTNSQIYEMLGKYKYGLKLLKEIGFNDDGNSYLNTTDIKYLKIYRTDIDMAYRNFLNELLKN